MQPSVTTAGQEMGDVSRGTDFLYASRICCWVAFEDISSAASAATLAANARVQTEGSKAYSSQPEELDVSVSFVVISGHRLTDCS